MSELVPYNESPINIEEIRNNGMIKILWLLEKQGLLYIECTDERTGESGIFYPADRPDETVYEQLEHGFTYADLRHYGQNENGRGYGA